MTENSTASNTSYAVQVPKSYMLDGPDSCAAYGNDALPDETVGEYNRRKEELARAQRSDT